MGIQFRLKKLLYDCYYINNEGYVWVRAPRLQCLISVWLQQLQCTVVTAITKHSVIWLKKRKKESIACTFFFFFFCI